MGRFEGFNTDENATKDNSSNFSNNYDDNIFAQRRLKREKEQAKVAQLETWKNEFNRCKTGTEWQAYIKRYESNPNNPYVSNAKECLDDFEFSLCGERKSALKRYISTHHKGKHFAEAKRMLERMEIEENCKSHEREQVFDKIGVVIKFIITALAVLSFWGIINL